MLWKLLLALKETLLKGDIDPEFISIQINQNDFDIRIDEKLPKQHIGISFAEERNDAVLNFCSPDPFQLVTTNTNSTDSDEIRLLTNYLPYALLPVFSRRLKRCLTITHFAQTLDGRISTLSGTSKWIGNKENLVHAHRMRALCDGVLVGSKTVQRDKPMLTVRHVEGQDPVKIMVGHLNHQDIAHMNGSSILINDLPPNGFDPSIKQVRLDKRAEILDPKEILNHLYRAGIHSVYIEGGALTSSIFLRNGCVDEVQLHLSPKIMGSGLTGFNFSGVNDVDESIHFENFRFMNIGNEIMFVGAPVPVCS